MTIDKEAYKARHVEALTTGDQNKVPELAGELVGDMLFDMVESFGKMAEALDGINHSLANISASLHSMDTK